MHPATPWSHRAEFPCQPTSASLARQFVGSHLVGHGLVGLVDDVRMVVSELATNAIVHARTPFSVTLQGDHLSVLLQVRDGSAVAVAPVPGSLIGISGRGLDIVDLLGDRWGTTPHVDGGKSVWVWFDE